jgi:hypothetical protein
VNLVPAEPEIKPAGQKNTVIAYKPANPVISGVIQ